MNKGAIGVFDSGYGGLTVLREIVDILPAYDYIYLGDNARAPYGSRSFDTVYKYTLQCVKWFFDQGCPLVILACNTASAKALRTIQQNDLEKIAPDKRVLGVIRPTSEVIGDYTASKHVGVFGTTGTIQSGSYRIEIGKQFPGITVVQHACPMWVPLIENNEHRNEGSDYYIKKEIDAIMAKDSEIDTILLACTHYPLIADKIKRYLPENINVVSQGEIVAKSLVSYLERHPEIEEKFKRTGKRSFFTTGDTIEFDLQGSEFFGEKINSEHLDL